MIAPNPTDWFLVLFTFSLLAVAGFVVRSYAKQYIDLKSKIHTIHALIELIDESMHDDKVTKEEFTAIIKRCLAVLADFL